MGEQPVTRRSLREQAARDAARMADDARRDVAAERGGSPEDRARAALEGTPPPAPSAGDVRRADGPPAAGEPIGAGEPTDARKPYGAGEPTVAGEPTGVGDPSVEDAGLEDTRAHEATWEPGQGSAAVAGPAAGSQVSEVRPADSSSATDLPATSGPEGTSVRPFAAVPAAPPGPTDDDRAPSGPTSDGAAPPPPAPEDEEAATAVRPAAAGGGTRDAESDDPARDAANDDQHDDEGTPVATTTQRGRAAGTGHRNAKAPSGPAGRKPGKRPTRPVRWWRGLAIVVLLAAIFFGVGAAVGLYLFGR
ncbi:hypothetical protein ACPYO6_00260 [Georgenia sp. Z1344]|uniref:hypothetical protein n=1 Tax=Georgenia sp. Z1344 TaxID=3416706 RepID=UPI003CF71FF7